MEVHHHPQVREKKFREYFLEFLMIFLAVTMGFFAETIREGITEHDRARIYASSMLKDLEADTAQLQYYRDYFKYAVNNFDTLMLLLDKGDPKDIPSGKLYWYGLFGAAHGNFIPNDATFQEMKSSGSLRFFKNNVENEVVKYDRLCRKQITIEQMNEGLYTEARKCRALFFNFKYIEAANKIYLANRVQFDQRKIDSFQASNPPLLNTDKTLFNQYVELSRSRFMRNFNLGGADSLLRQASLLIGMLKKDYRLQDE